MGGTEGVGGEGVTLGEGSCQVEKRVTRVEKKEIFNVVMKETTGWTEFFTGGNVGLDRVSRRRPYFCHTTTKVTALKIVSRHKNQKCHAIKKQKCHAIKKTENVTEETRSRHRSSPLSSGRF